MGSSPIALTKQNQALLAFSAWSCFPETRSGKHPGSTGGGASRMKPELSNVNVRAPCPDCGGAFTTFENAKLTSVAVEAVCARSIQTKVGAKFYDHLMYRGLRCAGCGRGGMSVTAFNSPQDHVLVDFFPRALDSLPLPKDVPADLVSEFQEAELTASVGAWRAASAMLRSTLEKALKHNGYDKGSLANKIDNAASDNVITAARSRRAHEDIRVLGNDVLHDAWRAVGQDEFDLAHKYAQRILEDLYDDRASVLLLLQEKERLPKPA